MKGLNFKEAKEKLAGLVGEEKIKKMEEYDFYEVEEGETFEVVNGFQIFGSGGYVAKVKTLAGEEPELRYIRGHDTDFVFTSYHEAKIKRGTILKNYEYDCLSGKTRWFKRDVYICL